MEVSDTTIRKRTRAQTRSVEKSSKSDASQPAQDRDDSFDQFVEVRPSTSKKRRSSLSNVVASQCFTDVLKGKGKKISEPIKQWVECYEKDSNSATVELLSILFEACGAKYNIEADSLDETSVDDVAVALVDMARRGNVEDYHNSKKKDFKCLKESLVSFLDHLVMECQDGPLFENTVFEKCMDFIIAISCTPPRIFRQVATWMGLQLVTSYIKIAKTLSAQRETTQRQINAEKKKKSKGSRLESLNKRLSTTHDRIIILEDMMRKIYTGYRDIDPTIRMSCIESLGFWILSYPSLFFQDLYLKYLGWTLNDKSAGVRKASILALQNLYDVDDNVHTLGLFTERFSGRMIELADDIDVSVAVCAIGLVKQLLRHQLIQDKDLGPLYDLLIDDPAEIRRAIGELVFDHLIAQKFNGSQSASIDDTKTSEFHLGRMLKILREFSTDPVLSLYVIDDVWEYMKAMKDWKCIMSMLLDESLSDDDSANLVRLLSASIRKAVGEKIVPATDNRKIFLSKSQKDLFERNKKDVTVALMKSYPLLLRKFIADQSKLPALVEIVVHLNMELYSLKRQDENFKSFLQLINEAFFKHGDKASLRSCVKAIVYCCSESQGELKDYARNKLKAVEDELIAKLKSAIKENGDEYSLVVNLKRLYEFQLSRALSGDDLFDELAVTLHSFRNVDVEVTSFLLLNMYLSLAWSLQAVVNSECVSESAISSLLVKRNVLFEELEYFIDLSPSESGKDKCEKYLASRVCIILAETWFLFRKANFSSTKFESLGFFPDNSVVKGFWKLCEKQLDASDEAREEEDSHNDYVEDTNKDAIMIAAAKLIASDTVSGEFLCPEIITHFIKHGSSVSEIVKHLISVIRKRDEDILSIFLESLKRAYIRHQNHSDPTASLQELKELADRMCSTLTGIVKNKQITEVLRLVEGGVDFAFSSPPRHLTFLKAAVLPFASKLSPPQALQVLADVQSRTSNVDMDEDPSGWRPYSTFVDCLRQKCDALAENKDGGTGKRRGRPRKKKVNIEGKRLFDDESSDEEEDDISAFDDENQPDQGDVRLRVRSSAKLRSLANSSKISPTSP